MRLDPAHMYDRFIAGDGGYDGRFFAGVMTTGIYCLPSCKARKPKRENIRFFPSCEAARAAGLRPCLKCRPDDFARGSDPVLETIEALVAEIRGHPESFADAAAIVRRSGFGTTRLFELVRRHFQSTPAELLLEARLARSKRLLLEGGAGIAAVALASGFESPSVFHAHFRACCGLTPVTYRGLRAARTFSIELPEGFHLGYLRRALSRDPHSLTERLAGDRYQAAVRLSGVPAVLTIDLGHPRRVDVRIDRAQGAGSKEGTGLNRRVTGTSGRGQAAGSEDAAAAQSARGHPPMGAAAHAIVAELLGLDQDAPAFARLAKRLGFARLVDGRPGLRIARTLSLFDGLTWAIIGQQINFPFACILRRRLVEFAGQPLGNGLYCPPTPEAVAALDPDRLGPLQFSRRKAEYLVGAAKLAASGQLDLEGLKRLSATRVERVLMGIRGLGPWSVNYFMMRSLGFPDCVPVGDTGVTSGLKALFALDERPDAEATLRLMSVFSPHRSLAISHLWQLLQSPP
ncbi:MAG: Ada metal-binding domain-containing protein [Opitutaceae bacterium]